MQSITRTTTIYISYEIEYLWTSLDLDHVGLYDLGLSRIAAISLRV